MPLKLTGTNTLKPYPIQCVSIVIPVYNEEQSLPELLRRTEAACAQLTQPYEIVLVDDGSRDESAQILQDAAEREGSPVVAVRLGGRPEAAVCADLIDGVLAVNRLDATAAAHWRRVLWSAAVGHEAERLAA